MALFGSNIKKMKEKGDIQGLSKELANKDPDIRVEAVKALGELKHVDALNKAIGNDDPIVCIEATKALANLGRMRELLAVLRNRHPEVRITAIDALKNLNDPESDDPEPALSLFEVLTTDADEIVQQRAYEALKVLIPKGNNEIAKVWSSAAVKLLQKKNFGIALKCFEEAVDIDPENKEMVGGIGVTLSDHGRHQDALRYAEKFIQLDSGDARGWGLKGICLFNLGKEDEALSYCQQALGIDPKLKGARDIVGAIYYKKGMYEVLVTHAQETLKFNPEDIKARFMLSETLAFSGRLVDAETEMQKALESAYQADSADAESLSMIYQQLGILCVMRGHEGALEYFERALKINQRGQWLYKLADACLILDMMGSLMKGTPQERRSRLLGYAQQREKTYGSYLEWKAKSGT